MAAGDFSASVLPDVIIKINDMFSGKRHTPELNQPIETVKALAERQTVRFDKVDVLLDHMDCRGCKVVWLKDCTNDVTNGVDTPIASCDITGNETESTYLSVANNLVYYATFEVSEEDCKDAFTASEKIAYLMATKMAMIEKKINDAAIAFLTANEQEPGDDLGYTLDGNIIQVPAADITPAFLADVSVIAELSNLYSPFIISGKNFYTARFLADYRSAGSDNVDAVFRSGPFDIVFDVKNIDTTVGANATFVVDPSSYVFWGSNQYQNEAPEMRAGDSKTLVWKQRAPRLMFNNAGTLVPVYFDITYQKACQVVSGTEYVNHAFRIVFRGGLQLGPQVCDSGDTGILQINAITE